MPRAATPQLTRQEFEPRGSAGTTSRARRWQDVPRLAITAARLRCQLYWRSDAKDGCADEERRDPVAWRRPPPGDPRRRGTTRRAVEPRRHGVQRRDCQRQRRPSPCPDEHVAGVRYVGTGVHTPNVGARMVRSVTNRRAMLHPGATPESAGRGHGWRAEQAEQNDDCRRTDH